MYRLIYVMRSGEVRISPDCYDHEWAGRLANLMGQCVDVAQAKIVADDDAAAAVSALLALASGGVPTVAA